MWPPRRFGATNQPEVPAPQSAYLAAISEALGWPPERLSDVLGGDVTRELANGDRDGVKVELARLRQAVDDLSERLAAVERQIGAR